MISESNPMLSPLTIVARAIVRKRIAMKLSQHKVARAIGCSQSYLSQVETGVRTVSKAVAIKLEIVLKAKAGSFRNAEFRRGRPPVSPETRKILRDLQEAVGSPRRPMPDLGEPRHPRPDRINNLDNPFFKIGIALGEEAANEVLLLEKRRPKHQHFWRQINSIPYDSWSEKRLQVKMGLTNAELVGVRPGRVGVVLPLANGKTGRRSDRQAHPAYLLSRDNVSIAMFPPRCVGTQRCHLWPDNLIVAAKDGRKVTAVIEIDGAEFHQDKAREKRRDQDLDVPVLHLHAGEIGHPGVVERIVNWIKGLFK